MSQCTTFPYTPILGDSRGKAQNRYFVNRKTVLIFAYTFSQFVFYTCILENYRL